MHKRSLQHRVLIQDKMREQQGDYLTTVLDAYTQFSVRKMFSKTQGFNIQNRRERRLPVTKKTRIINITF